MFVIGLITGVVVGSGVTLLAIAIVQSSEP